MLIIRKDNHTLYYVCNANTINRVGSVKFGFVSPLPHYEPTYRKGTKSAYTAGRQYCSDRFYVQLHDLLKYVLIPELFIQGICMYIMY